MKPDPCLVIAGTHSGVGKTTVTLALLSALTHRVVVCRRSKRGRIHRSQSSQCSDGPIVAQSRRLDVGQDTIRCWTGHNTLTCYAHCILRVRSVSESLIAAAQIRVGTI